MDPEKASSLAPELNNQDIPVKFNIILKGFRARLVIADVMLNQLEMKTYATTNHKVLFAVPDHEGGDDGNEVDNSSTNKTDQQIRTLVTEMKQLKNHVMTATVMTTTVLGKFLTVEVEMSAM